MGYRLGVDVGTTFTAAAVDDGSGPRMVGLGNRALQVPSVLFLQDDGSFLFGEAAERRGSIEPAKVIREFKRRFGDTVPILVAGQPFSPQALTARLLAFVIGAATEREGSAPDEVVLTQPANWGGYKRELMDQVIAMADLPSALTCTEPEAAAIQYASRADLAEGAKVAVYDLGGGTFDICVLQKQHTGFRVLGAPEGVEHLGGIDFDEAVFQHALRGVGEHVARLDLDDPQVTTALTRLRRDCVEVKEALSSDVDTALPVTLPGLATTVRLTRAELESLITPALRDTLAATHRALRSAETTPDQLAAIVLVGGSSRIPLVSHLLQSEFAVPTALDTHPKHDIALGAVQYHPPARDDARDPAAPLPAAPPGPAVAHWPTRDAATETPPAPPTPADPAPKPPEDTIPTPVAQPIPVRSTAQPTAPPPQPVPVRPTRPERSSRFSMPSRPVLIAIAAALLGVVAVAVVLAGQLGSEDPGGNDGDPTSQGGTPDATTIPETTMLIHLEPEGEAQLYSFDVESGKLVPLGVQGSQATISPDREQFIFQQGGAPYLADWNAPTTSHALLGEDTCAKSDRPAWSPDGTELAVVCQPGDSDQAVLLVIGTDGGEIDRVDVEGMTGGPTWVDEDTIVCAVGAPGEDTDLWQFNLDSRKGTRITRGSGFDVHPNWSEDQQAILFLRKPTAETHTEGSVIMALRGTPTSSQSSTSDWSWDEEPQAQQLADAQLRLASPTWSPNGAEIAFLGTDDQDDRRLYVLETDGDTPEEMAADSGDEIQEPGPAAWDSR